MEKEVLKERLTKLVEIGLSKNKTLDFNDVNDFFAGETLTPEELEFVYTYLERKKIPFFVAPLMGGLVTGLAACMAHVFLPATQLDKLIIGTMKVLLPGLALSKAMRDLLEGNLISGNSKVVEVLLIACSIAAGVAVALTLFQMTE